MTRFPMSKAAAGLLRALLARVGEDRHRILLTDVRSTDWQSLTFVGERHELRLALVGSDRRQLLHRLTDGLGEMEFLIPGQIVADVAVEGEPREAGDGSIVVTIGALTVSE